MYSEIRFPSATVYPDSDKVGVWVAKDSEESRMLRGSPRLEYYDGEAGAE